MRFDDMLATVLQQPVDDGASRAAAWRQMVDILAQSRTDDDVRLERDAYHRLREWRATVGIEVRRAAADTLVGRRVPARLVCFFAEDLAIVAAPLLATARLEVGDWLALLPKLTPTARGILRHRQDLQPDVSRALDSFGATDLVLGGPPEPLPAPAGVGAPVAELLDRIASFRRPEPPVEVEDDADPSEQEEADHVEAAPEPIAQEAFGFETGVDARIVWTDAEPVAAIVGLGLLDAAWGGGHHGVDGHVAGAVRARAPFSDARLSLPGEGPLAGDWRISAVPLFDPASGRFAGYRGSARRPRREEQAARTGFVGGAVGGAQLHQLMHEVRTPLNAIVGFAEMIEHGILGAAPRETRERASDIAADAWRLIAAVDDLELAARLDDGRVAPDPGPLDLAALLDRLRPDLARIAAARGARLDLAGIERLPDLTLDHANAERMIDRLTAALVATAAPGETVAIAADVRTEIVALRIARGAALRGRSEEELLGADDVGDGSGMPLLGLGFSLRLVRSLATSMGGALDLLPDSVVLRLPLPSADAAVAG